MFFVAWYLRLPVHLYGPFQSLRIQWFYDSKVIRSKEAKILLALDILKGNVNNLKSAGRRWWGRVPFHHIKEYFFSCLPLGPLHNFYSCQIYLRYIQGMEKGRQFILLRCWQVCLWSHQPCLLLVLTAPAPNSCFFPHFWCVRHSENIYHPSPPPPPSLSSLSSPFTATAVLVTCHDHWVLSLGQTNPDCWQNLNNSNDSQDDWELVIPRA